MSKPFDRDLYMRAWHFAATRHLGQHVKDSPLPYITHVGDVAMEVLRLYTRHTREFLERGRRRRYAVLLGC